MRLCPDLLWDNDHRFSFSCDRPSSIIVRGDTESTTPALACEGAVRTF